MKMQYESPSMKISGFSRESILTESNTGNTRPSAHSSAQSWLAGDRNVSEASIADFIS